MGGFAWKEVRCTEDDYLSITQNLSDCTVFVQININAFTVSLLNITNVIFTINLEIGLMVETNNGEKNYA